MKKDETGHFFFVFCLTYKKTKQIISIDLEILQLVVDSTFLTME